MNFIGIQTAHTIPSVAYRQSPLRTEYESVLPFKAGDFYSKMADQDGVVVSVGKDRLVVKYKDDTEAVYNIGVEYGGKEGIDYRHSLITNLKDGDRFSAGDPLYYHKDFFEPDWLDPKKIVYKINRVYTVAITTNEEVFEDSSAISERIHKEMSTEVLQERRFLLNFNTDISELVEVGQEVGPNDSLFINMGENTGLTNLNEATIHMLESLTAMSPRAKYKGIIDRIEIKYNGDITDMSPSLNKLATKLDRDLYRRTKNSRYEAFTNQVNGEYVSKGTNLELDTIELKIYIRMGLDMGVGDKLVFSQQAKSVVSSVMSGIINGVDSGDQVDAMFSYIGFVNRMITSPFLLGTTNRLVRIVGKQIADDYFS